MEDNTQIPNTQGNNPSKADTSKESNETKKKDSLLSIAGIKRVYEDEYKKLLIIPFALLMIALIVIGVQIAKTGDFIYRDVSLKGGVTITVPIDKEINIKDMKQSIQSKFPSNEIETKSISRFGKPIGIVVEADIGREDVGKLVGETGRYLGKELAQKDYSVEVVGSSLGTSFFKEAIIALCVAFVFMAIVVFLYFRTFVPSAAVIIAAFSDIVLTLAAVNALGMKISSAGIAAFLMLIGYSVDTDILLSTRVLKRKEGTVMDRVYGSISTGMMMTVTALIAVLMGMIVTQSDVIRQIMIILFIGLLADIINTWIQNVGILRLYLEKKARKTQ